MMNSGSYDFPPDGVRGDMMFSEGYYRQSGRTFDARYFPEAVLSLTGHNEEGPLLPPSTGYVHWLHEAENIKRRAGLMMAASPTWTDEQPASTAVVADGGLGYSPSWWCCEQQRQHQLRAQEQAETMPAASWTPFGQTDDASSVPWPTCEVPGPDLLVATAAQPLNLQDMNYPLLDDVDGGIGPYPELDPGPIAVPAKSWLDSSGSYSFPSPACHPPPYFPGSFSPSLEPWSSAASLSGESDFEAQFAGGLSLSEATESTGGASAPASAVPPASNPAAVSSPCRKGRKTAKGKPPSIRSHATKSRKRLPCGAARVPCAPDDGVSQTRRSSRLVSRTQARGRSPSSSSSSSSDSDSAPSPSSASSTSEQPRGPPCCKIEQMDMASRHILETTLLRDRDVGRGDKIPYSVITRKLRHLFCGAEETLRGHHRKLLLPKDQRVRRPVWKPYDVLLLQEAVMHQLSTSPKRKISWTAVSQHIHNNGGSYKFGITACSRKWKLLQNGGL